jgi:hypothetical protein
MCVPSFKLQSIYTRKRIPRLGRRTFWFCRSFCAITQWQFYLCRQQTPSRPSTNQFNKLSVMLLQKVSNFMIIYYINYNNIENQIDATTMVY